MINRELYLRLLQTNVLSEIEAGCTFEEAKAEQDTKLTLELSKTLSGKYINGIIFARYLVFLKKHMKRSFNQIWSFKVACLHDLKSGVGEIIVAENWNTINAELDVSYKNSLFDVHITNANVGSLNLAYCLVSRKSRLTSVRKI